MLGVDAAEAIKCSVFFICEKIGSYNLVKKIYLIMHNNSDRYVYRFNYSLLKFEQENC